MMLQQPGISCKGDLELLTLMSSCSGLIIIALRKGANKVQHNLTKNS